MEEAVAQLKIAADQGNNEDRYAEMIGNSISYRLEGLQKMKECIADISARVQEMARVL